MRRSILPIAVVAFVAGCSSNDDIFDVTRAQLFPNQQAFDPRFQIAAGQGARQLKLALLEYGEGSIVLFDSARNGVETWITADGGTLETRDQMLVGMNGFGAGFMAADVTQSLAMVRSGGQGTVERFHTYLTGNDETETRTYVCQIADQGSQEIVIGTGPVNARLVSEECRSLDQAFQNLYWVAPGSNRIVQTSQWTGEFVGMVATQVVP